MKTHVNRVSSSRLIEAHTEKRLRTTTVAVIGLGYVGLPLAIAASVRGYKVVGFDIDIEKVAKLRRREAEYLTEEERDEFRRSPMQIRSDEAVLRDADVYIICVPTPVYEDHTPNLEPLIEASKVVGRAMGEGALVVVESTVNPGACEEVSLPILKELSKLEVERDFYFAHCPERINPGDNSYNVRNIPRVLGASGKESLERAKKVYTKLIDAEITLMGSIKEAEAVKMVENSFRDINIAFVNELAMSFEKAGIDIVNVIRGASTKPFSFMPHFPGCGVGGHCIPVDPYYLIRYGHKNGFVHRLLIASREINNHMPRYTVELLLKVLRKKKIKPARVKVALLGLAYKKDIPDLRESPALVIKEELESLGIQVSSFDPFAIHASSAKSLSEALRDASAVIVATDHSAFRALTPDLFKEHGVEVVIDGRNCLSKEEFLRAGITYQGIGH